VAYGDGLENRCPRKVDRGFESHPLRRLFFQYKPQIMCSMASGMDTGPAARYAGNSLKRKTPPVDATGGVFNINAPKFVPNGSKASPPFYAAPARSAPSQPGRRWNAPGKGRPGHDEFSPAGRLRPRHPAGVGQPFQGFIQINRNQGRAAAHGYGIDTSVRHDHAQHLAKGIGAGVNTHDIHWIFTRVHRGNQQAQFFLCFDAEISQLEP
jgi:hypothetical protein